MRYVSGGHACTYMLATLKPFFLLAHRHGYHAEYDNKEDTRQEQPHIFTVDTTSSTIRHAAEREPNFVRVGKVTKDA